MISLDTNILARFYLEPEGNEDEKQRQMAARTVAGQSNYVTRTVILELEWVLRGAYKLQREKITGILAHLTSLKNVFVEDADLVDAALSNYAHGMDFADALHLEASARCEAFLTFDRKLSKNAQKLGINPPCTVPH